MFGRATAAALATLLSLAGAAAQPVPDAGPDDGPVRIHGPSTLTLDSGTVYRLPGTSVCVAEEGWERLDVEVRRLQDSETRLEAENLSLRGSAADGWGWGAVALVVSTLAAGIGAGAWAFGR